MLILSNTEGLYGVDGTLVLDVEVRFVPVPWDASAEMSCFTCLAILFEQILTVNKGKVETLAGSASGKLFYPPAQFFPRGSSLVPSLPLKTERHVKIHEACLESKVNDQTN